MTHEHEDVVFDEAWWDGRYNESERIWSGKPNAQLVAEVAGLTPGSALDVGSGEGSDAIWLAEQGWQVTGVDISKVALARAAEHARERGVTVDWLHTDLTEVAPTTKFDLVTAHFFHLQSPDGNQLLHRRLASAVAPGGTLLIVGHSPQDMHTVETRPKSPFMYYTAQQVEAVLEPGDWTVVVSEARPRTINGMSMHDEVLRAQRR
ncbi:2-polyprenyl-3-methyl-5-hydroxy-6-metoxy-1,4-benzoquinol methylase [Kibdelosporangium banguiense]|uniref:2-polyprenyl-3-methyl-5-hydroxy-6-metoxy-1, 4-benzoquinol methylase n=1 Tax=Kibdelosporangium banguiense TaxID=1365924 RepID=A0ABS4TCU7_9PSEU|nr:class I SAM-dependent methyltransferase [Kibdelosporangium banguiense]MBP2322245.1 2-polyprenyl-3-methyl-5-hydroxy-6-metoxy-1,4-benzoquinol methylase [Kibdelosporangium banguiense]